MATCIQEIHVGDIGTVFEVTLMDCDAVVDISSATDKKIIFQKPSGALVVKDAVFTTDGTDGKIRYITVGSDLDAKGSWKIQAKVTLSTGSWSSNIDGFKVYANLGA